jgi:hypothetical protein
MKKDQMQEWMETLERIRAKLDAGEKLTDQDRADFKEVADGVIVIIEAFKDALQVVFSHLAEAVENIIAAFPPELVEAINAHLATRRALGEEAVDYDSIGVAPVDVAQGESVVFGLNPTSIINPTSLMHDSSLFGVSGVDRRDSHRGPAGEQLI